MKGRGVRGFCIIIFLTGFGILSYPIVSNWLSSRNSSRSIEQYIEDISYMTEEQLAEELEKALTYNHMLTGMDIEDPFVPDSGFMVPEDYSSILNVDGLIGYIEIPIIDVYLPIRHGTDEEVLQKGIGHLEATGFPVGGEGTHAVLTGHRGLPSAELFTNLDKLETGDIFFIYVLNQKIAYQVERIRTVEPDQTEELKPVKGEDYVTLITCTPYGVNTHRLLVRGTRIELEEGEGAKTGHVHNEIFFYILLVLVNSLFSILLVKNYLKNKRRSSILK